MADQQDIAATFLAKLKDSPFVMAALEDGGHSEPLTAQIDEDRPNTLYFFTAKDNRVARGGAAMVQFVSKGHDFFACMAGTITPDNDRAEIDKLWSNQVDAWFDGGRDDPKLCLLRFDITNAELWETDISVSGRVKMLFGGTIDRDESSSHAMIDRVG